MESGLDICSGMDMFAVAYTSMRQGVITQISFTCLQAIEYRNIALNKSNIGPGQSTASHDMSSHNSVRGNSTRQLRDLLEDKAWAGLTHRIQDATIEGASRISLSIRLVYFFHSTPCSFSSGFR
jgi:hypothetical protein